VDPVKLENTWHIPGDLNIRLKSYLKIALGHLKKVTDSYPDNKLICLTLIPRYLTGKCCKNPEHVKNFTDPDFQDMQAELEKVSDLITAWLQAGTSPSLVVDYRVVADVPEAPVPDLVIDGQSIWQEADPIHPTATFYAKLSEEIFSALEDLEAAPSESAPKRARLESIVVKKATKTTTNPANRQSWSACILPLPAITMVAAAAGGAAHAAGHAEGPAEGAFSRPIGARAPTSSER
jgi:hypothetical protein